MVSVLSLCHSHTHTMVQVRLAASDGPQRLFFPADFDAEALLCGEQIRNQDMHMVLVQSRALSPCHHIYTGTMLSQVHHHHADSHLP